MAINIVPVFFFIIVYTIRITQSHWWLSSQVFSVGSTGSCSNIVGLVREQKKLCQRYPSLMGVVGAGAKLGLSECQHQFATSKWNCSHVDQRRKGLLGLLTSKANREAAFFQAITSAGVVMEVTKACNKDDYHAACTCDYRYAQNRNAKYQWDGCNDNIKFGMTFSRKFLDAREVGNDARVLMNKQNNLAGRMAVNTHMRLVCSCHGVSGACNIKTCRYSLPEFYTVGDFLQQKYHGAVFVTLDQMKNTLVPRNIGVPMHTETELVYLEESPDYCVKNLKEGTLGVAGRRCNRTSPGPDGCDIMCCGMGFHTKKVWMESNCKCKFIWCCEVKCRKCRTETKQHFCRGKKKRRRKNKRRNRKRLTQKNSNIQRDFPLSTIKRRQASENNIDLTHHNDIGSYQRTILRNSQSRMNFVEWINKR
nr:Wnt2 protein [Cladonema pacificum]